MYLQVYNKAENILTTVQVEPSQKLSDALTQAKLNMSIVRCDLDLNKTIEELGLKNNDTVNYEFTTDVHQEDVCVMDTEQVAKPAPAPATSVFNPFAPKPAEPINPFANKATAPVNPFATSANKTAPVNPFAAQNKQTSAPVNPFASAAS